MFLFPSSLEEQHVLYSWLLTLGLHCGKEECGCFPFALFMTKGREHLLAPALGASSCGLHLSWFLTLPPSCCLLLASYATSFLGKASQCLRQQWLLCQHPLLPFGGQGFCVQGTWEPEKSSRGVHKGLSQPVSSPSAQMQQRVSGWCLSTSFLHLPGKAERTSPALFSPGESENYSPQLWARQSESLSAWWEWAVQNTGGEGDAGLLYSSISGRAMEQESLPWASEQISSSRSTRGFLSRGGFLSLCFLQHCFTPSFRSQRYW